MAKGQGKEGSAAKRQTGADATKDDGLDPLAIPDSGGAGSTGDVPDTGLDDAEWGVTLLAKDTIDIKAIVYEMRFDPVSVRYGEFGDFSIGMQMPLDELFRRLCL